MTLSTDVRDNEAKKFRDTSNGPAVAVVIEDGSIASESKINQILSADDRVRVYSFLDFGTRNERISTIVYSAPSVGTESVTITFNYVLDGNRYRLINDTRTLT